MMTSRPKKPDAQTARMRIISGAKECFALAGFEGTSTRQIAAHAGVAQSLVLYHFDSKDALWRAVMDHIFAATEALDVLHARNIAASIKQRLTDTIDAIVRLCEREPDLHRLMTLEGRCQSERLSWLVDTHLRGFFEPTRDLIIEGQKEGTVRQGDPTMLYYTMIAIAGSMFSLEPEMRLLDPQNQTDKASAVRALIQAALFAPG